MRILIKSLSISTNFGCILQAYALQKFLSDMGHDVKTLDVKRKYHRVSTVHRCLSVIRQLIKRLFLMQKDVIIDYDGLGYKMSKIRNQYTQPFVEANIKRVIVNNEKELDLEQFDCIIAGSDQVWRYYGSSESVKNSFLLFARNWKGIRIAYAASYGLDSLGYPDQLKKECKELITLFDAVSVREDSGVDITRKEFNCNAIHVLDPTFLLEKRDYINLFQKKGVPKSDGDLLCYILDDSYAKRELVNRVSTAFHMIPFYVNATSDNPNIPFDWRIQPSVEQWLRGFYDASFVITDSFHAVAFSIIFNKPFLVYLNEKRGAARMSSLLKIFGLEERIITTSLFDKVQIFEEIDWDDVNERLNNWKNKSMSFLIKNCSQSNVD